MEKKDKPSSEPSGFEEDDIIDLSDTLQDDEIIDLTEPDDPTVDDASDELIDLDMFLSEKGGLSEEEAETEKVTYEDISDVDDDVIDLTEHAGSVDDDIIELVDVMSEKDIEDLNSAVFDSDDDVIDLTESVTHNFENDHAASSIDSIGDDTIDLVEPLTEAMADDSELDDDIIELDTLADVKSGDDFEDDVIELIRTVDEDDIIDLETLADTEFEDEQDDDIINLTRTIEEDDIIDLDNLVEVSSDEESVEDVIDLTQTVVDEDDIIDLETLADTESDEGLDDDTIDLTQRIDDSDVIDLGEPVDIVLEEDPDDAVIDLTDVMDDDDDILDLTQEISSADEVDDSPVEPIEPVELTESVSESADDHLLDFLDMEDEDVADKDSHSEPSVEIEENDEDLDFIDEEVLDLTESAAVDMVLDTSDNRFEETVQDFSEAVNKDSGFTEFAEQTSDNLQFDLSETLPGETSRHSIINAEPVNDSFDFESFAEQTIDNLSFKAMVDKGHIPEIREAFKDDTVSEFDITNEINKMSLDEPELKAMGVTQAQLDLAVERAIRKIYSEKLDEIFKEVIGRAIAEDIERIKEMLTKQS